MFSNWDFFTKIIVSILVGALIGIEREHRTKGKIFAGFRSFMLVSLFGLLTGWLSQTFSHFYAIIDLVVVGTLAVLSHWIKFKKGKRTGVTTELAFLITFLIGFILFYDKYPYVFSIFLAFILVAILFAKETLHEIAYKATTLEIRDTIIFTLIAFVIFPLLPDRYLTHYHIFNPRLMWKGIVIILGLSYFSYLIFKVFKSKGIKLNSFFSGLVNSMYVSYEYSYYFSKYPVTRYLLLIAISSMIFRAFLLSSIINPALLPYVSPLLFTAFSGYLIGILKTRRREKIHIKIKSPLSLKFAFFYGAFFTLVVCLANFVSRYFGANGIYALSAIIGLVDVSSLTVALSTMKISPIIISRGIIILTTVNVIGNWLMTVLFGKKEFSKATLKVYLIPLLLNTIILTSTFLF